MDPSLRCARRPFRVGSAGLASSRPLAIRVLVARYACFAAVATAANLGAQFLWFRLYPGSPRTATVLAGAMAAGTLVGLGVKYWLDKRWIFRYQTRGLRQDAQKFFLYTVMGGFTTLLFWATEAAFHHLFPHPGAKYLGALLGLTVGYLAKYRLDRRFVFATAPPCA